MPAPKVTKKKKTPEEIKETEAQASSPEEAAIAAANAAEQNKTIYGTANPTQADIMKRLAELQLGDRPGGETPLPAKETLSQEELRKINAKFEAQILPEQKQKTIVTGGNEPQGIIGTALSQSPLGLAQKATGLPLLDVGTPDVERLGRTAAAAGGAFLAAGLAAPTLTSVSTGLASINKATGGLAGIGLAWTALDIAKDYITGNKADNYIASIDGNAKSILDGIKAGTIDPYEAQVLLNEAMTEVEKIESSVKTGNRKYLSLAEDGKIILKKAATTRNNINVYRAQILAQIEASRALAEQQARGANTANTANTGGPAL